MNTAFAPARKLTDGEKHFLRLIANGADLAGWAPVSKTLFSMVDAMPKQLIELESVGLEGRGRARLTKDGENLLTAMEWL